MLQDAANALGLGSDDLLPFGRDKAKVVRPIGAPRGKLVLVTAINPTPSGEGKTTTSIGLVQALHQQGHSVCGALREPSLGPCFGVKGGGTGGGKSVLVPTHILHEVETLTDQILLLARGKVIERGFDEGKTPAEVLDDLYLRALSRRPSEGEREELLALLGDKKRPVAELRDVFWAVLNSREFLFNH